MLSWLRFNMSSSQNYGDTSVLSKEHPDSTFCDEGCSGASPTSQDRMILKKGPWTASEDALLIQYVKEYGEGNWNAVQKESGLLRCGKSCRLRWANHLRPHLKKGTFSPEEEQVIIMMHSKVGNKWAQMAACLPGRTDNEIKNYWNTRIKRLQRAGLPIYPNFDSPTSNENQLVPNSSELSSSSNCGLLHGDILAIPDFQFDSHRAKSGSAAYVPTLFPDNVDPYTCSYLNPGENRIVQTTVSLPNTTNLRNENLSSSRPESGTAKMELPSLQFPETDYVDWINSSSFRPSFELDPYFQSPNCVSEQPQCDSSRNNGLLSDLVHESRAISSGKKRTFDKISANISVLHTNTDPTSPFCLSAVSLFNWRNPIVDGHMDEFPAFGLHLGSEEALPGSEWVPAFSRPVKPARNDPEVLRPDALLGSDLFFGNIGHGTGDLPMTNLHEEQTPSSSGAALFSFMKSHPWARMPHAFQISER